MMSDRGACLAAGMDDYVTKPIRRLELLLAFDRLSTSAVKEGTESPVQSESAFDRAKLLDEIDDNLPWLQRLATSYFEHTPELQRAAHTWKGSLIQFVARLAIRRAARLEEAACACDATVASLAAELTRELEQFAAVLGQFLGEI